MMTWQTKMGQAMDAMREACRENNDWTKCHTCPFDIYCTALMDVKLFNPLEGIEWADNEE